MCVCVDEYSLHLLLLSVDVTKQVLEASRDYTSQFVGKGVAIIRRSYIVHASLRQ